MLALPSSVIAGKAAPRNKDWLSLYYIVQDIRERDNISSKSPKPLFGAFGQTEKTGFKVFGSFQPGLPRKVPQSL